MKIQACFPPFQWLKNLPRAVVLVARLFFARPLLASLLLASPLLTSPLLTGCAFSSGSKVADGVQAQEKRSNAVMASGGITNWLPRQAAEQLNKKDKAVIIKTLGMALDTHKSNHAAVWRNDDSDHHGTVTPLRSFEDARARHCRDFIVTVVLQKVSEYFKATACRQKNGAWFLLKNQ